MVVRVVGRKVGASRVGFVVMMSVSSGCVSGLGLSP